MLKAALLFSRIHLHRYMRVLNQLGIFRVAFLAVIVIYGIKATLRPGMLQWQALLIFSMLAQSHFNRKDFVLTNNLGINKPWFFMLLYLILSGPFIILYAIWPDYKALLILISGIILISFFLKPVRPLRKITLPSFRILPADAWEWRTGIRRVFPYLLIAYVLPAVFFRFDYIFPLSVLGIAILVSTFQQHHEPVVFIEALKTNPASFLRRKIYHQCMLFTFLVIPLILASVLLYPEETRPVILVFFNSLIVQAFAVSLKYAGYSPGSSNPYHSIILILLSFAFIIPAMLPIPLLLTGVFSRKALNQLKLVMG
ncbi:MAG: hypothetical protein AB9834_04645 [Lentimicrobium sp.]